MVFWDWKTGRIKSRVKCHSKVVIAHEWLEHETSKVVTASWDGLIKLWVRTTFASRCCIHMWCLVGLVLIQLFHRIEAHCPGLE